MTINPMDRLLQGHGFVRLFFTESKYGHQCIITGRLTEEGENIQLALPTGYPLCAKELFAGWLPL